MMEGEELVLSVSSGGWTEPRTEHREPCELEVLSKGWSSSWVTSPSPGG